MIQLDNIDEPALEVQTSSSVTTVPDTTTEEGAEDLDAHLLSLEAFQEDCRRRLAHLGDEKRAMSEPKGVTAEVRKINPLSTATCFHIYSLYYLTISYIFRNLCGD